MGKISVLNPLPFHLGANPSPTERVYRTMRRALGRRADGREVAGPALGLEDQWRIAKARVLARERQRVDLAFAQYFPDRATVALGELEEELAVEREDTDEARRAAVAGAYTRQLEAVIPAIRQRLQQIDENLDVITWSDEATRVGFGQWLRAPSQTWNQDTARKTALRPNFASEFVVVVLWATATLPQPPKRRQLEDYLDEILPAWVDWRIVTGVGFRLDLSRLDLTAFGA